MAPSAIPLWGPVRWRLSIPEPAANPTAGLIVLGETPRLAEHPRIALSPLIGEGSAAALPSNLAELVAIGVTKISEIGAIWGARRADPLLTCRHVSAGAKIPH